MKMLKIKDVVMVALLTAIYFVVYMVSNNSRICSFICRNLFGTPHSQKALREEGSSGSVMGTGDCGFAE
ncbi:hypothetical protein [Butyrivibrio sp. INlla21]|uniref:hypothetical protein n=1 Tax=Butyrivibrio sp. INlla21 TaxID=1520811 RepID=UPI0008E2A1EA|nr:hypothetical protein [Butyrivibrio sp. INlla21]SFU89172.1 hypothetical protein SAMN02910342_02248 [Butyrivibrio sp. INlla21]